MIENLSYMTEQEDCKVDAKSTPLNPQTYIYRYYNLDLTEGS